MVISFGLLLAAEAIANDKPRLIVLTDIGGDPDDQQSMIRLMVHANEFEIEGLIASAAGVPGELKTDVVKPGLIREIVEAYGKAHLNLTKHDPSFPEARTLLDRIKSGNPHRGTDNIGAGKDTEGSKWIVEAADRKDDRPLNIVIWGGSTELAQALWRVRNDRKPDGIAKFLRKIRIYSIGHQDNTGPWINKEFPDLFFILSKAPEGGDKREGGYRGMYLGGDESLTSRDWIDRHVRKDHGPLGALYPTTTWTAPNPHATLKEGDTPSWFYFLPVGLGDVEHPEWGCWGGRFKKVEGNRYEDARNAVGGKTESRSNVYRWRPAYQNEFAARMDWCVKSPKDSNHLPIAIVNGDKSKHAITIESASGRLVKLSAAGSSDPDGNDIRYRWFIDRDAGTFGGELAIQNADKVETTIEIPAGAKGKSIHMVLEITDDGKAPLTRYRRVVVNCK
jgi:hypothetical protein